MEGVQALLDTEISIEEWLVDDPKLDSSTTYRMSFPNSFDSDELDKLNIKYVNVYKYSKNSGKCSIEKIIKMCVENNIHNPLFIMEYRHQTDPQYKLEIILNKINRGLYIFDNEIYFEDNLPYDFDDLPFYIDFKKNSKLHKLLHINVYVIDDDFNFLHEEIERITKLRNIIQKLTPKESYSDIYKYFNLA
jgi:hypothetical protein